MLHGFFMKVDRCINSQSRRPSTASTSGAGNLGNTLCVLRESRGTSPSKVHDIALKVEKTGATERVPATFGRLLGLVGNEKT
jgi:hypothetical protein